MKILIALTIVNLAVSGATLSIMVAGARRIQKAQQQVEEKRATVSAQMDKFADSMKAFAKGL